jgi:hypothetical protein
MLRTAWIRSIHIQAQYINHPGIFFCSARRVNGVWLAP